MSIPVGTTATEKITVTEDMIQKFAEVSGDYNPIHMDDEFAKTSRFGKRIAHGMLSGAFISRCLANFHGAGGIYLSQTLKFLHPIYIGDEISVTLTLRHVNQTRGMASIDTIVTNQKTEVCVKGEATIMSGRLEPQKDQ